jgi:hypothetical protein
MIRPVSEAQLSIGPGTYITLKEGGSLMIGTDLHIKSVQDSSGYFVDQTIGGDVTITGNITVDRYMTANVWHNVASPVSNETSSCFTGTDLVFWYDETQVLNDWNFGWIWYYGATGGPLDIFRGYDVYFNNNPVTVNYYASGAGGLNTGSYTIPVYFTNSVPGYDPKYKGWNLLGNPYPSPVDWLAATGWNKSDINDAKYIWNGVDSIYTIFIGGGSPYGINGGTRFIPSNQGFWVQSVVASGTVGINNAVRVGDITGTPDYYKLKPADYPLVSLIASGNNRSDEVIIRFIAGTTEGFDINYDASKLFSPSPNVPQIFLNAGNQAFALNTLSQIKDNLCVLLSFQSGKAGLYHITLTDRTNLDLSVKVYLKDELDQKISDLTKETTYGFYHDPSNAAGRFKVYFNPSEDIINDTAPGSYFSVYSEGNLITIVRNTTQNIRGKIFIYNMLGQPVHEETLGNHQISSIYVDFPTGYYIVDIITDQRVYNSKILVIN